MFCIPVLSTYMCIIYVVMLGHIASPRATAPKPTLPLDMPQTSYATLSSKVHYRHTRCPGYSLWIRINFMTPHSTPNTLSPNREPSQFISVNRTYRNLYQLGAEKPRRSYCRQTAVARYHLALSSYGIISRSRPSKTPTPCGNFRPKF